MPWPGGSRQAPTGRRWAGDPTIHSLPIRPCSTPTTGPSALPHLALRHAIIDAIILAADLPDDAVTDVRLTAGEDLGDDVVRAIELDRPGRDGGSESAEG